MIQSIKTSEIGLELSRKGAKTQSYFFCISLRLCASAGNPLTELKLQKAFCRNVYILDCGHSSSQFPN